jgi:hypothetical protein
MDAGNRTTGRAHGLQTVRGQRAAAMEYHAAGQRHGCARRCAGWHDLVIAHGQYEHLAGAKAA